MKTSQSFLKITKPIQVKWTECDTLRYLPPTNTGMRQHMVANSQGVIGCIVQGKKKIKSLGCRPCIVTMD
jgi:hypothetical protein